MHFPKMKPPTKTQFPQTQSCIPSDFPRKLITPAHMNRDIYSSPVVVDDHAKKEKPPPRWAGKWPISVARVCQK